MDVPAMAAFSPASGVASSVKVADWLFGPGQLGLVTDAVMVAAVTVVSTGTLGVNTGSKQPVHEKVPGTVDVHVITTSLSSPKLPPVVSSASVMDASPHNDAGTPCRVKMHCAFPVPVMRAHSNNAKQGNALGMQRM